MLSLSAFVITKFYRSQIPKAFTHICQCVKHFFFFETDIIINFSAWVMASGGPLADDGGLRVALVFRKQSARR